MDIRKRGGKYNSSRLFISWNITCTAPTSMLGLASFLFCHFVPKAGRSQRGWTQALVLCLFTSCALCFALFERKGHMGGDERGTHRSEKGTSLREKGTYGNEMARMGAKGHLWQRKGHNIGEKGHIW